VCDDGAFCTINDACQSGVCAGGGPRTCNDNLACTFDFCLELADTCSASPIVPCCGNGAAEAGEDCDDGNASNNDACLTTCTAASCGDGFVRTGVEQCDQGAANADTPNASCRTDCRLQRCGDGILDDQRNEQCDDGGVATGDGCSPRCFLEPPASARLIPGRGNSTTDCAVEWKMDRAALDRLGVPSHKQSCQDGDPACDFGSSPGECTFRVWSCSNNTDSSLPACVPGSALLGTVFRIETSKPSTRDASLRPEDGINRQQLLRAASAGQVATPDACGPRMDVRVPLKTPIRKGSKTLKVKATTTRSVRDSDVLKLFCLPAAP
jgi:cysteine-rich repeat protein